MKTLATSKSPHCDPPQSSQDHPASLYHEQASEQAPPIHAGHGMIYSRLFPEPDQFTLPPKTPWDWLTILKSSMTSTADWKNYRTKYNRLYWMLAPSDCQSEDDASGYWPTPLASDDKYGTELGKPSYLRNLCLILKRPDLMKSVKFRLKLMGFPEDYLDDPPACEQSETQ